MDVKRWWNRLSGALMGMLLGCPLGVLGAALLTGSRPTDLPENATQVVVLLIVASGVAGGFWDLRLGIFRAGRAVVVSLLALAAALGFYVSHPARPESHAPAQTTYHFSASELHVGGVAPGMTETQVSELLGQADSVEDGEWRYAKARLKITWGRGRVYAVEGPELSRKEGVLVREHEDLQKARDTLGLPRAFDSTPGQEVYSQWDPEFVLVNHDGRVTSVILQDK